MLLPVDDHRIQHQPASALAEALDERVKALELCDAENCVAFEGASVVYSCLTASALCGGCHRKEQSDN